MRILPAARVGAGAILGGGGGGGRQRAALCGVGRKPRPGARIRFDESTVARLLQLRWWDWPIDTILAREALICGADIAALERAAG